MCVTLDCIDEAAIIYMIEHPIIYERELGYKNITGCSEFGTVAAPLA